MAGIPHFNGLNYSILMITIANNQIQTSEIKYDIFLNLFIYENFSTKELFKLYKVCFYPFSFGRKILNANPKLLLHPLHLQPLSSILPLLTFLH